MGKQQKIVDAPQKLNDFSMSIIKLLQTDGRMTTREIAQTLNTSEITVRKYLKHLRESGTVDISATVEPSKVGYSLEIVLHLRINTQHLKTAGQILNELPEVRFLAITSGAYGILCVIALQSAVDLSRFLTDKVWVIEGLESVDTTFMLETLKRPYEWSPFHEVHRTL